MTEFMTRTPSRLRTAMPDDPADPYGTPPLLGVEWTEKVTGRRVAS